MGSPSHIGPYEVVGQLGQGGMATVFEVRDPQADRRLALKLNLRRGSKKAQARFMREAEALARIRHPAVARIHDVGEAPEGLYLIMELIEGESLADRLRRLGPLAPPAAVSLLAAVCEGVAAIHAAGLVHRDIKPANVMLRAGSDEPVLLDLGLVFDESVERLTATGQMVGTPDTMSPEQISGSRDLDGRTDVYGLGVLLYMALCGQPPFAEDTLLALAAAITRRQPVWPDAPDELLLVLQQAMAKSPDARYPTATALREDLLRYASGERVSASGVRNAPPPPLAVLVVGALLVSLALLAFVGLSSEASDPTARSAPAPGHLPTDPPKPAAHDPARELERNLALRGPKREEALAAWLRSNPRHERAPEAWGPFLRGRLAEPTTVASLKEGPDWRVVGTGEQVYAIGKAVLRLGPDGPEPLAEFPLKVRDVAAGPAGWLAIAIQRELPKQNLFLLDPSGRVLGRRIGKGNHELRRLGSQGPWLWAGTQQGSLLQLSWAELQAGEEHVQPRVRLPMPDRVRGLLPLPDGRVLGSCAGSMDRVQGPSTNDMLLWDPSRREPLASLSLPGPCYFLRQLPGKGRIVAGLKWVQELRIFALPSLEPTAYLISEQAREDWPRANSLRAESPAHTLVLRGVEVLPGGLLVSMASTSTMVDPETVLRVWDVERRLELASARFHGQCSSLAYGDGRVWTCNGRILQSWDLLPE